MALKYLYVPSGVQAETAYGVMPNSANADFASFSRSSAGSRVDKNRLINTGLGLGSEEVVDGGFDNASSWATTVATISNSRAIFIDGTGAYSNVRQGGVLTINKTYEVAIDVVINSGGGLKIQDGNGNTYKQITESGVYTFRFTSIGASSSFYITRNQGGVAYDMYVERVSVREVTEVNTDVPRLDYTGGGCPSLLLEPTSTNYLQYSEDLSNSWSSSNILIGSASSISPEGGYNAFNIKGASTSNVGKYIFDDNTSLTSTTYTLSAFFKKKTHDFSSLIINQRTSGLGYIGQLALNIDLVNGIINTESFATAPTLVDSDIEYYKDGWYRVSLTATTSSSGAVIRSCVGLAGNLNNFEYAGSLNDEVYVWGVQLEKQSYATSYIPNYGNALGVTRLADNAGGTGDLSSVVNSTEGVLYVEIKIPKNSTGVKQMSLNNGTTSEAVKVLQLNGSTFRFEVNMSSGSNFVEDITINPYQTNKFALQYKSNEYKVFVNGIKQTVTQRTNLPTGLNKFSFNRGIVSTDNFYGKVKEVRIHDEALIDVKIEELTSWSSLIEMVQALNYRKL